MLSAFSSLIAEIIQMLFRLLFHWAGITELKEVKIKNNEVKDILDEVLSFLRESSRSYKEPEAGIMIHKLDRTCSRLEERLKWYLYPKRKRYKIETLRKAVINFYNLEKYVNCNQAVGRNKKRRFGNFCG